MLERLLIVIGVTLLGVLLYWGWRRFQLRPRGSALLGLEEHKAGLPLILYFKSPTCVPCRTVQTPVLQSLQEQFGNRLQIIAIDATERPEVADYWGVLSLPSTFIFDGEGTPQTCNMGVASAEQLTKQLAGVGLKPQEARSASIQPVMEEQL